MLAYGKTMPVPRKHVSSRRQLYGRFSPTRLLGFTTRLPVVRQNGLHCYCMIRRRGLFIKSAGRQSDGGEPARYFVNDGVSAHAHAKC